MQRVNWRELRKGYERSNKYKNTRKKKLQMHKEMQSLEAYLRFQVISLDHVAKHHKHGECQYASNHLPQIYTHLFISLYETLFFRL